MTGLLNMVAGVLDAPARYSGVTPRPKPLTAEEEFLKMVEQQSQASTGSLNQPRRDASPLAIQPTPAYETPEVPNGFIRFLRGGNIPDGLANLFDKSGYARQQEAQAIKLAQARLKLKQDAYLPVGSQDSGVMYRPNFDEETLAPTPQAMTAYARMLKMKEENARRSSAGAREGSLEGIETYIDPTDGKTYRGAFETMANGAQQLRLFDMTGARVTSPEVAGRVQPSSIQNSYVRGDVNVNTDQIKGIYDKGNAGQQAISNLSVLRQNFKGAASTGYGGDFGRWLNTAAPSIGNILGFDLNNQDQFEQAAKSLELAMTQQYLKGQGQVTEAERKIVRETLPNLRTNPAAFEKIIDAFERVAKRNVESKSSWNAYKVRTKQDADFAEFDLYREQAEEAGPDAWKEFRRWAKEGGEFNVNAKPADTNTKAAPPAGPGGVQTTPSGRKWSIPGQPQSSVPPPPVSPMQALRGGTGGPMLEASEEDMAQAAAQGAAYRAQTGDRLAHNPGGLPAVIQAYEEGNARVKALADQAVAAEAGAPPPVLEAPDPYDPRIGWVQRNADPAMQNAAPVVRMAPNSVPRASGPPPTLEQLDRSIARMRLQNKLRKGEDFSRQENARIEAMIPPYASDDERKLIKEYVTTRDRRRKMEIEAQLKAGGFNVSAQRGVFGVEASPEMWRQDYDSAMRKLKR